MTLICSISSFVDGHQYWSSPEHSIWPASDSHWCVQRNGHHDNTASLDTLYAPNFLCQSFFLNIRNADQEVLGYYVDGMRVPDDVTLLWADDTWVFLFCRKFRILPQRAFYRWGNMLRLPLPSEFNRTGGAGVYYHVRWLFLEYMFIDLFVLVRSGARDSSLNAISFRYWDLLKVGPPRDYKWITVSNNFMQELLLLTGLLKSSQIPKVRIIKEQELTQWSSWSSPDLWATIPSHWETSDAHMGIERWRLETVWNADRVLFQLRMELLCLVLL